ncbi:GTP cyclohydrolase II [Tengunoibacter tsumagoiensis]|uniref:GTP cyclohydrolase-2 n=1 Tax=Tengunoibacter tsumagoiensis TaxID=2014871 RepID=A0A402AAN7_9CHLR|nr:GTP cyclohydrolase II [Tengunoibacter tsumagoiensis]GCE16179.1 riboflavin biosynthesis protein RibBA [Tengunoibacter tsumagoiensis]
MEELIAPSLLTISDACQELRAGHIVFLFNEEQPQLICACLAAQFALPAQMDVVNALTTGRFYALLSGAKLDALYLTPDSYDPFQSKLSTESQALEAHFSAEIYAEAARSLVDPTTKPEDLPERPVFRYLRAHPGGTLQRPGYTEAVLDLLRIAGLEAAAIVGQVINSDSVQAALISVQSIQRYRQEHLVSLLTEIQLPTALATFRLRHYQELATEEPYLALLLGESSALQDPAHPPLLRVHSSCVTGDLFGSQRCDCQAQMHTALQEIAHEGRGIFLYLPQEGRGIGLAGKLQAYLLQEQGADTIEANQKLGYPVDARNYRCALEILLDLGIKSARLLTNNPEKIQALEQGGITIERVALETRPTSTNLQYLFTKQQRMGHVFSRLDARLSQME